MGSLIFLWILVGWCGTVPRPLPPVPLPDPPRPRPWLVPTVIGVLAGIAGGWAFSQLFLPQDPIPSLPQDPIPLRSALYAATTSVGAFVLARVASDIYGQFFGARPGAGPDIRPGAGPDIPR
jgi:hypothetical protein